MRSFAFALVFACASAGCRPAKVARPYAPPTLEALVAGLDARAAQLTSLRAEAKIDHRAGSAERVKVRVTLIATRAAELRLEAESPLGGSLATLVSDGKDFSMLDVRKNRFLVGTPSACNVGQLLGLELSPKDVLAILSGGVPGSLRGGVLSWDPEGGGREKIDAPTDDHGRLSVWLRGQLGAHDVVDAEYRDALGIVRWRVHHDDYADEGGIRLPHRSTISQPARKAEAEIRYRALEPNVAVPPEAFKLTPPDGIAVERVDCGGE